MVVKVFGNDDGDDLKFFVRDFVVDRIAGKDEKCVESQVI